jgi:cell division protein FtsL
LTGLVCALVGESMYDLVASFAICLLMALAAYAVRGIAGRYAARLEQSEREGAEMFEKSPQAAWRELDRQRMRNDIRHHYWR